MAGSVSSLLKYHFVGHSERSAAAGEGGAARSRGTPSKVRSAREADKHRLLQPCRTRLTRGPSTALRPLCRLRSARDDHAFEVFQQAVNVEPTTRRLAGWAQAAGWPGAGCAPSLRARSEANSTGRR